MSRVLLYARLARTDLNAIFDFIAADNPTRAISYVREIEAACEGLCSMPLMGIARSDLHPGLRTFPLRRRIVIAYVLPQDRVRVLRIFSGGQDFEAIMAGR